MTTQDKHPANPPAAKQTGNGQIISTWTHRLVTPSPNAITHVLEADKIGGHTRHHASQLAKCRASIRQTPVCASSAPCRPCGARAIRTRGDDWWGRECTAKLTYTPSRESASWSWRARLVRAETTALIRPLPQTLHRDDRAVVSPVPR